MKAFPRIDAVEIDDKGRHLPQLGMDLRDYFAAKAMQGMASWDIRTMDKLAKDFGATDSFKYINDLTKSSLSL